MPAFLEKLFDTSDFPARWHCGHWTSAHGWTHIISDVSIMAAYSAIPIALAAFWWVKRSELAFPRLFWLFAAFIFSCGTTHLVEAIIFYHPIYRFSALMKVVTAVVSWATVIALVRAAPKAFELPGLRRVNERLERQLARNREVEEALRRSNRNLEAFSGVVTHDLKNPMSGSLFAAELLRETLDRGDLDQARTQVGPLLDSLGPMSRLIRDLHAEALSQQENPALEPLDLEAVLEETLAGLASRLRQAGAKVDVERPLPLVLGRKVLLVQLFGNLIENSVKYAGDEPPEITVVSTSGNGPTILVRDNGRGIAEGELERIFRHGERGANTGDTEGSGMGLSICRRIMENHGGSIAGRLHAGGGTEIELRFQGPAAD
ncbi:sensor histidine kinase [Haloferula sargassicola]|uniref:histidine kinase n=1 Tax=Haloferula sargassicola TaxID=490096 RepID=A0ABP9UGR8_9BACT